MAAYTAPAAVRDAMAPALGTDQASAVGLSDVQIQEAIDNACAQVDAVLHVRYPLPLPLPIPTLVATIAQDIAAWLATLTWRANNPIPPTSPIAQRYDRATTLLAGLGAGTIELPGTAGVASGASVWNTSPDFFRLGGQLWPQPWYGPHEVI